MSSTDGGHEHEHECTGDEAYARNIAEQRTRGVTRRDVLRTLGASGLLIAGGAINAGSIYAAESGPGRLTPARSPYRTQGADAFDGFFFLSGDHHIHTRYSPDAKYAVQRQVAEANYHGLDWMVITDHGGATHNKLSVDLTYPEIVDARDAFKEMLVFAGLEMNIPGAEHGTVMVLPNAAERTQLKDFEAAYDGAIAADVEETMLAGLRWLDQLDPKPIFFANHPSRRGLDSPHEIRAWKAAAPEVAYGFEGAPGHQAAGLLRDVQGKITSYRGFYGNTPGTGAHPGYPLESYFTYGGFDWMTAKLGGLWDSLLGDGLRWWITLNSDSHKYYNDLQDVDAANYNTLGFVSEPDRFLLRPSYGDFRPGEYGRSYVLARDSSYGSVMAALRAGRFFVVHGDLIDRLKFTAETGRGDAAGLGDTLGARRGESVRVSISVRVPAAPNHHNARPMVDHIDLIAGDINNLSRSAGPDNLTNPSTRVVATFSRGIWREQGQTDSAGADGLVLSMEYTFEGVAGDFYVRLRGTNTGDRNPTPEIDTDQRGQSGPAESPWDDLWFYSNPIFIRVAA